MSAAPRPAARRLAAALALCLCAGCASTPDERDALEPLNRALFVVDGLFDSIVLKPVAGLYVFFIPAPIRDRVSNVVANATYLDTVVNGLLQGELEQSARDLARFAVNTTAGIGGVFDPATGMGLEAHDEDFGKTLASWGVPAGSYLVVPVIGPTTLRDLPGAGVSFLTSPVPYLEDGAQIAAGSLWLVDRRSRVDPDFERRAREAPDPYSFVREAWLSHREHQVGGGDEPATEEESGALLDELDALDDLDGE